METLTGKHAWKALCGATAVCALLLGFSPKAHAATQSLFIDQKSPISEYTSWKLELPGDATFSSSLKTKIFSDIETGSYKLSVVTPAGASPKITLVNAGVVVKEVQSNTMEFDVLPEKAYRITVEFSYVGTVQVLSEPAGIPFEMESYGGVMYTGTTPATFDDMAPVWYRVTYSIQADCEPEKQLERGLVAGSNLTFYKNFTCGNQKIPTAGRTNKPLATTPAPVGEARVPAHTESPDKHIEQTVNMSEVVPGGRMRFTVTVHNRTRETLHNIVVTDRFNPEAIDIALPLFDGGIINGNQIEWTVPQIYAGQRWTTTFEATAKNHLVPGDRIVLLAHAVSEESDADIYPEAWSSVVGVGIAYLPQTGDRYDILLSIAVLLGATVMTHMTLRKKNAA